MSIFDRVAAGLDEFGRKAAQALDEGKLKMDLARVRRRRDNAARDLGYLAYRKAKGELLPEGEMDAVIRRIEAASDEIAAIERDIAKLRTRGTQPGPAPAAEPPPAQQPPAGEPPPAAQPASEPAPGDPPTA